MHTQCTLTCRLWGCSMIRPDRFKSQRAAQSTIRYKKRFVDGGIICNKCKKVKKKEEYHTRRGGYQSYCKKCSSDLGKLRNKRNKYKLW